MLTRKPVLLCLLLVCLCIFSASAIQNAPAYYAKWKNSLMADTSFFPIGVWLQEPSDAPAYKAAGVNLFIGLWAGPTASQLQTLTNAGMKTICDQNISLAATYGSIIAGWMQNDEPDNAQSNGTGGYGRGTCTGHTEMYPEYIKGCDIVSYDIYPYTGSDAPVMNNPWYVALGIDNLNRWSNNAKPAWCFIECTQVGATGTKPTPGQVKAMVWMALIHGAMGIEYFCHQFSPTQDTRALLHDAAMLSGVTALNQRIISLAPVLNDSTRNSLVSVASSNTAVPVDRMVKVHGGNTYIFAASMRSGATTATFTMSGMTGTKTAEVIDESRNVTVTNGVMSDAFSTYQVHLYKIANSASTLTHRAASRPAGAYNRNGVITRLRGNGCVYDIRGNRRSAGDAGSGVFLLKRAEGGMARVVIEW